MYTIKNTLKVQKIRFPISQKVRKIRKMYVEKASRYQSTRQLEKYSKVHQSAIKYQDYANHVRKKDDDKVSRYQSTRQVQQKYRSTSDLQ